MKTELEQIHDLQEKVEKLEKTINSMATIMLYTGHLKGDFNLENCTMNMENLKESETYQITEYKLEETSH